MINSINYQKDIPIRENVDILVAGGGPSGVTAAAAAARQGCNVYLIEGQSCLGGMGTAGLVPAFMQFSDGANFLAAGIGEEIFRRLRDAGGTGPDNKFSIKTEVFKRVYDELLLEADVDFSLQTNLIDVRVDSNQVTHAILAAKSGIFAIKAQIFIDCTGDGDLATWAGAPYEKGDADGNVQASTLCSLWTDIDWDKVNKPDDRKLEEAFKDDIFTHEDRHLPGMWRVGENNGGGNIGHVYGVDSTDERSLTAALIKGRRQLLEYKNYYKKYLDGYEDMELVVTAALMGIRESRRIMGDYKLGLEDFKNRAVFADEIGRYSYPVDIHASKPDPENYQEFKEDYETLRYDQGESYGIPYRCLTPVKLQNVLVAGRCVSTDRYMQGSIRVMPGCYITGQAAGAAASICVRENTDTRSFEISHLQQILQEMGGYLPNFR